MSLGIEGRHGFVTPRSRPTSARTSMAGERDPGAHAARHDEDKAAHELSVAMDKLEAHEVSCDREVRAWRLAAGRSHFV